MTPTSNETEDVLSFVTAMKGLDNSSNLCSLLTVSKGMQAAVVSKGSNSNWTLEFHVKPGSDLARTARLAEWLQKYHMLPVASLNFTYAAESETADDHAVILSLGLRHPLQLTSISISGVCPLKPLLQLDAQKLTCLCVSNFTSASQGFFAALAAEIGRMTNLQHLEMGCHPVGDETITWNFPSGLTGLTSLCLGSCFQSSSLQHVSSRLQHFGCQFLGDEDLGNMQHLVHLTSLLLYEPKVTGAALTAAAQHMSRLQSLHIVDGLGEQLQALRQMPHLQYLLAGFCTSDMPSLTANIAYATSLIGLHLIADYAESATAADLSGLSTLVQLQELKVRTGKHDAIITFGDHILDRHLMQLRHLSIYHTLHPQSLAQVLLATQLTSLEFDGVEGLRDGTVLGMLANMHNLQELCIRGFVCQMAEVSVIVQSWLPNLRYLELYGLEGKRKGPAAVDEWLSGLQLSRPDLKVVVL